MMIRAVIFDMDGLMFDTERLALASWKKAGEDYGYTIEYDLMSKCIGKNLKGTKSILQKEFGKEFPFDIIRKRRMLYTKNEIVKNGVPIKNGLFELLDFCKKKKIMTAVATSTDREHAEELLRTAKVIDYFKIIVCGDEVEKGKPAPDIFLKASEKLKIKPCECIVLEDSENGIKGANEAKMIPVFIPDLLKETNTIKNNLKYTCETLNDVIFIIEDLM